MTYQSIAFSKLDQMYYTIMGKLTMVIVDYISDYTELKELEDETATSLQRKIC